MRLQPHQQQDAWRIWHTIAGHKDAENRGTCTERSSTLDAEPNLEAQAHWSQNGRSGVGSASVSGLALALPLPLPLPMPLALALPMYFAGLPLMLGFPHYAVHYTVHSKELLQNQITTSPTWSLFYFILFYTYISFSLKTNGF